MLKHIAVLVRMRYIDIFTTQGLQDLRRTSPGWKAL